MLLRPRLQHTFSAIADTKYLHQRRDKKDRRRGTVWYLRVPVPPDLQTIEGRKLHKQSLRTESLREARHKRDERLGELRASWRRMRENSPPTDAEITVERRRAFAAASTRAESVLMEKSREHVGEWLNSFFEHEGEVVDEATFEVELKPSPERLERAKGLLERLGAEPTGEAINTLAQALLEADFDALDAVLKGLRPRLDELTPRQREKVAGPRVSEADELWVEDRNRDQNARPWTAQTLKQVRATLRLFSDFTGDDALAAIGRNDVARYLETVGKLNPLYARSAKARDMSLKELLEAYPSANSAGLSNRTLNRHAGALVSLFDWAIARGNYNGDNPAKGHSRKEGDQDRCPFTTDELQKLLSAPVFHMAMGGQSPAETVRSAKRHGVAHPDRDVLRHAPERDLRPADG